MKIGSSIYAVLFLMLIGSLPTRGQRIKMESGSVDVLSDQKNVNVIYDYSDFRVGKFATEKEYLDKKSSEYNTKEGEMLTAFLMKELR